MIICVHEDRIEHIAGLKLTLLSILRYRPDLSVFVSFPNSPPSLHSWLEALPNTKLIDDPALKGLGWNVKPTLLLYCLSKGYSDVVWIDADIIINRDFKPFFSCLDEKTMVVAQEYYWGPKQEKNQRALTWDLKPGISLPANVNSGVIRVTSCHKVLLENWQSLLNHPAYKLAQTKPTNDRPLAMIGDQEVLNALLSSDKFSHISLKMLKRGVEIAQCFKMAGYTPSERIKSLFVAPPYFIHAMGNKPWRREKSPKVLWQKETQFSQKAERYFNYIHQELTPYTAIARQYKNLLGEDTDWLNTKSIPAKLLTTLFFNHSILQEFPLSIIESVSRRIYRFLGKDKNKYISDISVKTYPLKDIS